MGQVGFMVRRYFYTMYITIKSRIARIASLFKATLKPNVLEPDARLNRFDNKAG